MVSNFTLMRCAAIPVIIWWILVALNYISITLDVKKYRIEHGIADSDSDSMHVKVFHAVTTVGLIEVCWGLSMFKCTQLPCIKHGNIEGRERGVKPLVGYVSVETDVTFTDATGNTIDAIVAAYVIGERVKTWFIYNLYVVIMYCTMYAAWFLAVGAAPAVSLAAALFLSASIIGGAVAAAVVGILLLIAAAAPGLKSELAILVAVVVAAAVITAAKGDTILNPVTPQKEVKEQVNTVCAEKETQTETKHHEAASQTDNPNTNQGSQSVSEDAENCISSYPLSQKQNSVLVPVNGTYQLANAEKEMSPSNCTNIQGNNNNVYNVMGELHIHQIVEKK